MRVAPPFTIFWWGDTVHAWTSGNLMYIKNTQVKGGDLSMVWTKPEFIEVRMDAEVSSYIFVAE